MHLLKFLFESMHFSFLKEFNSCLEIYQVQKKVTYEAVASRTSHT